MEEFRTLLKTIRSVGRSNPVTGMQLSEIIRLLYRAPVHIETGRLTELDSRIVNVEFNKAFFEVPAGWIKVYRMKQLSGGRWKQYDVLYYHTAENWKTTDGFSLQIDPAEALAGIVIEYKFQEA